MQICVNSAHLLEVGVAAYGGGVEGEAAEQEAEAEQRVPGGHPGVYPGTWQQQILGSSGTRIATITPLAGTERSAGTGHQVYIYLQISEHYSHSIVCHWML